MNTLATLGLKHLKDILIDNKIEHTSMESNEEIISRLKFIGFIGKNEKINVRYVNIQPNDWYTTISRTILFPDNRSNALKFVRDVINRSFQIIDYHLHKQDNLVCKALIIDLIKSQEGLLNLKYTYKNDTKFCCDLDVLIERVVSKLSTLREEHELLFIEEIEKSKQ